MTPSQPSWLSDYNKMMATADRIIKRQKEIENKNVIKAVAERLL